MYKLNKSSIFILCLLCFFTILNSISLFYSNRELNISTIIQEESPIIQSSLFDDFSSDMKTSFILEETKDVNTADMIIKSSPNALSNNSINITKTDSKTGNPITDTNFQIIDSNNNDVTDKSEKGELEIGEYTIKEKISPQAYNTNLNISKEKLSEYKKLENYFYTPFIATINTRYYDEKNITTNDNKVNTIKLKPLLEAIENDKKYSDIYSLDNNDKVKIYVLGNNFGLDNQYKNLFMLSLNDNKEITNENKKELEERATHILDKCSKIKDQEELKKNYRNYEDTTTTLIIPEKIFVPYLEKLSSNIYPVYTDCNYTISYDLYYKNKINTYNNTSIEDFLSYTKESKTFYNTTNIQVKDSFTYNSRFTDKLSKYEEQKKEEASSTLEKETVSTMQKEADQLFDTVAPMIVRICIILSIITMCFIITLKIFGIGKRY